MTPTVQEFWLALRNRLTPFFIVATSEQLHVFVGMADNVGRFNEAKVSEACRDYYILFVGHFR